MSKSKCSVKVVSSTGESWTTKRGALRLVDRGLAFFVSARSIRMSEICPSFSHGAQLTQGPRLEVVTAKLTPGPKVLVPHGFLHYPQPGSFKRRRPLYPLEAAA